MSITKSLKHSAIHLSCSVEILWVEASDLEEETHLAEPAKYAEAWAHIKYRLFFR